MCMLYKMTFPLEDLPDYDAFEFLERLDDGMLYTMCTQPISKRISNLCSTNDKMVKRLYIRIMKHMLSDPQTEISLFKAVLYSDHNKYNYDPDPEKFGVYSDSWEKIIYMVEKHKKIKGFLYTITEEFVYIDEKGKRQRTWGKKVLKDAEEEEVIEFIMDKYEKGFVILDPEEEPFKFNDQGNPLSIKELIDYLNARDAQDAIKNYYATRNKNDDDSESSEESE